MFYISKEFAIISGIKENNVSIPFCNEWNKTVFLLSEYSISRHYPKHMCSVCVRKNTLAYNNGSFNFPWELGLSLKHLLHLWRDVVTI